MSSPPARLPDMAQLANEYIQLGASYKLLGQKYGCSGSTVRNRLKIWADEQGKPWPLKPDIQTRGQNRDAVDATLVRKEILGACARNRISQGQLAEICGVSVNLIHKITSGYTQRVLRKTQGKVLEGIIRLERGEVKAKPEQRVILPMQVRDRCPNNHPYTGARDSNGRRRCNVCRAYKDARRYAREQASA